VRGLSANISLMYGSLPFLERLEAAAADGFAAVEFWVSPAPAATAKEVVTLGLEVSAINVDPGPGLGAAGLLSDPSQIDWWRSEFLKTLDYASRVGCRTINALAGGRDDIARSEQFDVILENLEWALSKTSDDVVIVLEPLNRRDRPSYLLHTLRDAEEVRGALGEPAGLRVLFDAFHLYQEHDDLASSFLAHLDAIGHVQIADVPGRGVPGSGSIDFAPLWAALADNYDGWIGLEYHADSNPLGWLASEPHLALRASAT
jgi:hydroxypyruvate isomerase